MQTKNEEAPVVEELERRLREAKITDNVTLRELAKDAIAALRQQHGAATAAGTQTGNALFLGVMRAYGHLWHYEGDNPLVHGARRALRDFLTQEQKGEAISAIRKERNLNHLDGVCIPAPAAPERSAPQPSGELELHMNEAAREFIYAAALVLCDRIEACGASVPLTHAVTLSSALAGAIGNKFNKPNEYDLGRVLEAIKTSARWGSPPDAKGQDKEGV